MWQGWLSKRKWVDDDYKEREFWLEKRRIERKVKGALHKKNQKGEQWN